jgi:hypothetical protein
MEDISELLRDRGHASHSLSPGLGARWALSILWFCVGAVALAPLQRVGGDGSPLYPFAVIAWLVSSFVVPGRLLRGRRVRWLQRLDLPLDRASYLDAINVFARMGSLALEVRLKDHAVLPATPEGLPPGTVVTSEPGVLRMASGMNYTLDWGSYGSYATNRPLHEWFRKVAVDVLLPLSRTVPIESIVARHVAKAPTLEPATSA